MDEHSGIADAGCLVLSDSESPRIGCFDPERQKPMIRFLTNRNQFYTFERFEDSPQYQYRICQYLSESDMNRGRHATVWEGHGVDHVRERWANLISRGFTQTEIQE